MADDVIRRFNPQIRKLLRRSLGGFERNVELGSLIVAMGNERLHPMVRGAAKAEVARRYLVVLTELSKGLGGKPFTFTERLTVTPCDLLDHNLYEAFKMQHESRASIWMRLQLHESAPRGAEAWLAFAIHYEQMRFQFQTLELLIKGSPAEAKPPRVADAMYGFGHRTVWVGFNWHHETPVVNVPPTHEAYSTEFDWTVKPFVPGCDKCAFQNIDAENLLRCPGMDHPRFAEQAMKIISRDGCPEFEHKDMMMKPRARLTVIQGGSDG